MNENIERLEFGDLAPNDYRKSKKGLLITIIVILIVMVIIALGGYFYLSNPKRIIFTNINEHYQNSVDAINENVYYNTILNNDIVSIKSQIGLAMTNDDNDIKIDLDLNYIENKADKEGYLDIASKFNNDELINIEGIIKDSRIYLKIKDVIDTYFYESYDFISLLKNGSNPDDLNYLIEIAKVAMLESIDDEKFETENTKIEMPFSKKKVSVQKTTFKITEELMAKIIINVLEDFKNDDKAIDILAEISQQDKSEVLTILEDSITLMEDTELNDDFISYSVYTKLLGQKVMEEIGFEDDVIKFYTEKEDKKITYEYEGNEVATLELIKKDGKTELKGLIDLDNLGTIIISGRLDKEESYIKIVLSEGNSPILSIETIIKNQSNEIEKDKKYEYDYGIQLIFRDENNTQAAKYNLDINLILETATELPQRDISNNKHIDDISIDELTLIYNNLIENTHIGDISGYFPELFEEEEDDYDYYLEDFYNDYYNEY